MANIPIDDLQIDIVVNASKAESAITKLANSLKKLEDFHPDTSKIKDFIRDLSTVANESVRIDFLTQSLNKLQKALAKFQMPKGLASAMQENVKQSVSPEDALMKVPSTKDVSAMEASFKNIAEQIQILNDVGKTAVGFYAVVDAVERLAATASQLKTVASSISKVSSAVGRANGSTNKTDSKTGSLGRGSSEGRTDTEGAGEAIEDTGNKTESAGNKAKTASKHFGGLFSSFKRIATYRALRAAIRAITQAFSEGVQNLVQWDAAFGNNTSGALATMTEIKSLGLQIKNTLGAMAMPIIQLFLPALRLAARVLMWIANVINQVVRAFQGYSTYMKAVYTETDYLGDSLDNASGKAKELQRVLFGFDELNVLPSPDRSGGSGGTGILGGGIDPFDEVEIESPIKSIIDDIKYWLGPLFTGQFWKGIWDDITYWLGPLFTGGFWKDIYDDIIYWADKAFMWVSDYVIDPIKEFIAGLHEEVIEPKINPEVTPLTETERFLNGEMYKDAESAMGQTQKVMQAYANNHPLLFKITVNPETGEVEVTRRELQTQALKVPPIAYGTKFELPTNGAKTFNYARGQVQGFGAINMKTQLQDAVNEWEIRNSAQKDADKQNPVVFKSSLSSIIGLVSGVWNSGQASVNKLNPITFAVSVATSGLGLILSNAWWILQNTLNNNPLTYATTVGVSSVSTTALMNRKKNIAQAYASGGVPDVGTLFWAGESGAEVVATMNNGRTGVMNVGQMEEAVAAGNADVVNAIYGMANMIVNAVNSKDLDVYMDTAKVGQSVSRYQSNQARRGVAY